MDARPGGHATATAPEAAHGQLPLAIASQPWDVVVVGGGPAGAATAIHLGARGHRVLLVERSTMPGRKACGEGLFPGGVRELEHLGVARSAEAQGLRLEGVSLSVGSTRAVARFDARGPCAIGVARTLLGPLLLDRARSVGAQVVTGVDIRGFEAHARGLRVVVPTEEGPRVLDATIVVGADGLGSRVRRAAGLEARSSPRRYGLSAHVRLYEPAPPLVAVHVERGYEVYVTPVAPDVANVAVLAGRAFIRAMPHPLEASFGSLVASRLAGGLVTGSAGLLGPPLAAGPFEARATSAVRGNVLLVGDAAGSTDPIAGQGMSLGLVTARLAAEAIDAFLSSGDPRHLEAYAAARLNALRTSVAFSRLLLWATEHPRGAAHLLRGLGRRPSTLDRLLGISSGEEGWSALRPRDLLVLAG